MSFKPQVITVSSGKFCGNALAFATRAEAEASARDLAGRWTLVTDWRAIESDEPVNHIYIDGDLMPVAAPVAPEPAPAPIEDRQARALFVHTNRGWPAPKVMWDDLSEGTKQLWRDRAEQQHTGPVNNGDES